MTALALSWFEDEDPRDLRRWAIAAVVVVAVHIAAIAAYLYIASPNDIGDDASPVTVELSPSDDTIDQPEIQAAFAAARTFMAEGKSIELLTLYEQRLNRGLQKNLAMLQQLQATRKAADEAAMKEAATLLKLSEMRGMEYQPARDGFVFSTAEIHAAIDRQHRLDRAATTDFTRYKPRKFQTQAA